jgi:hypothetical protein
MTICVWCMMLRDMLILLLLCISDHNQDKEHTKIVYGMDKPLI